MVTDIGKQVSEDYFMESREESSDKERKVITDQFVGR